MGARGVPSEDWRQGRALGRDCPLKRHRSHRLRLHRPSFQPSLRSSLGAVCSAGPATPCLPLPAVPGGEVWLWETAQGTCLPSGVLGGASPSLGQSGGCHQPTLPEPWSVPHSPNQNERNHQKCCSHSLAPWGPSQVWEALTAERLGGVLRPPHSLLPKVLGCVEACSV